MLCTVLKYQVAEVAVFLIAFNRCLSLTFLLYYFNHSKTFIKNYERVSSETTKRYICFMFSIACKINLGLIKNSGKPGGRGGVWPWKSGWEGRGQLIQEIRLGGGGGGGGGSKTLPSVGGVLTFSGITQLRNFEDAKILNCDRKLK